ncbi:MAG: 50S ribosomal protein L6 [Deltaproteobacteria bacterium]|nr:50S ribosomal protein L6 [Deltaproteobacteria bacterium]
MSRIGKRPITLPQGVTITTENNVVTVKGQKTSLSRSFANMKRVKIEMAKNEVTIVRLEENRDARREQGLVHALLTSMVKGVSEGFARSLEIIGVGYRAEVKGKSLGLTLGFSHPVNFPIPEGLAVTVDKQIITLKGADRWLVGETAAKIRRIRPPEPYKGKGVRYTDEVVRRKVGKSAASAGAKAGG